MVYYHADCPRRCACSATFGTVWQGALFMALFGLGTWACNDRAEYE
ncbi:MAG: hypothetical protein IPF95_18040 [Flavobacteriales bacterium]|nr:hypothetical protein [Flavobacteriales bacterium]